MADMKKRILSLILALQMAATLLPTSVWAEGEDTVTAEPAISAEEPVETPEPADTEESAVTEEPAQPTETEDAEDAADTAQIPESVTVTETVELEPVTAAAMNTAEEENVKFLDRFIPVRQVYAATPNSNYHVPTDGSSLPFSIGTNYIHDNYSSFSTKWERKDFIDCYFKATYLGTYGTLDKDIMKKYFCYGDETSYKIAMNEMEIPEGSNYSKWIDKDTIIVQIDLYDENKQFIKTVNKYSAIMAVAEDGTFLTFSMPDYKDCSLFFSRQDDLFKAEETLNQLQNPGKALHIQPVDSWITDINVVNNLLGDIPEFEYEFIQHGEITGKEQYMTNNIISANEFIDPYDTYYMVGRDGNNIDPVVKVKIENVKDYAEYLYARGGDTWRHLLLKDGRFIAVGSGGKTMEVATGVTQISRSHYLKNGALHYLGTVSGKMIDEELVYSGVKSYAEHIYGAVVGYIKNDGSCYLQYSYSACEEAYGKGAFKVMDKGQAKMIVPGGIIDKNNTFYRWTEKVTGLGYDEAAWSRGEFIEYNDYELGKEYMTDNAVRVFSYEKFLGQYDPDTTIKTGFVQNARGEMWAFGLQARVDMGIMEENGQKELIKHIFPVFESQQPAWKDNGHFVGFVPEENGNPYAMVANHCSNNVPKVGKMAADYLSDVPGGYKATDRYTYAFDNNADDGTSVRQFRMVPTEFHYLNDSSEVFMALNTSTNPVGNLYLLPNVARSSYHLNNSRCNTVLLERTDGSMWMTQLYPRSSASITVSKLGGWECSNAIQITPPTNTTGTRTRFVDYIDLVDRDALESSFPGIKETKYPEDGGPAAFMESDYYTQITPGKADKLYRSSGDPFLLLVTKTTCGNCQTLQRSGVAKRIIEEYGVPIYGAVVDQGNVSFPFNYRKYLTTPYFALVYPDSGALDGSSGVAKRTVEIICPVTSGQINESQIIDMVKKAKELGVKTDKSLGQPANVNGKVPTDKLSVSQKEWDVLKLVNRARRLNGKPLLAMPNELQRACNIRENELTELYEHKRPNGKSVYTTIPAPLNKGAAAENIACNQYTAAQVVDDWMHSPGHCANILDAGNYGLAYMGVGFINSSPRYWVQLFTTSQGFTSVTSSSGSLTFPSVEAMQKEYLICTDKEGVVSYLPIDVQAMTQSGDSYKLELVGRTVTLTIAGKQDPTIDMNGDGQASVSDMQCLFEYLSTGKAPANASFMKLADVNGDNEINILDYQAMYQRLKS